MKRKLLTAVLLLLGLVLVSATACAETRGTCGDNVSWVLDDEGTLTISGSGSMWAQYSSSRPSWALLSGRIKKVVVQSGVTNISQYLFSTCDYPLLTEVQIADSVRTLGQYAFAGCTSLAEITIPYSASVESYCFSNCSSLAEVTIPSGVSLGSYCFSNCSGLREVTISDSVSIGSYCFSDCAGLTEVTIPGSTGLGSYCFSSCTGLESVRIEGCTETGDHCFQNCTSLTNVSISGNVSYIGDYWFKGCSALKEISIALGVRTVGYGAFEKCDLRNVVLPESVVIIHQRAFYDNVNMWNLSIPQSVTQIGPDAIHGCRSLGTILLPDNLTRFEIDYWDSTSVQFIYVNPDTSTEALLQRTDFTYRYAGDDRFEFRGDSKGASIIILDESITDLVVPEGFIKNQGAKELGLVNAQNLISITLPKNVKISGGIFYYCTSLRYLRIPKDAQISDMDLTRCESLESLVFEEGCAGADTINCMMPTLEKVFLPRSITILPETACFSEGAVIYCYKYSVAAAWAEERGYEVVLLDDDAVCERMSMPETLAISLGQSTKISINAFPVEPEGTMIWQTDNPEVATVSRDGVVTVNGIGTATISLSWGGMTASTEVTGYIYETIERIVFPTEHLYVLLNGSTVEMPISVEPEGVRAKIGFAIERAVSETYPDSRMMLKCKDGKITVQALTEGELEGKSVKPIIWDKYSGIIHFIRISFMKENAGSFSVSPGEILDLGNELFPEMTWPTVEWSTDSPAVISLTPDGKVMALKKGSATVYAQLGDYGTVTSTIEVTGDVSSIRIPPEIRELDESVFEGTSSEQYIIADGVQRIGPKAFAHLTGEVVVIIPTSVTEIAADAFEGSNVVIVCEAGSTAAQYAEEQGIPVR